MPRVTSVGLALAALLLAGCGGTAEEDPFAREDRPTPTPSAPAAPASTTPSKPGKQPTAPDSSADPDATAATTDNAAGSAPPPWLGQRPLPRQANGLGQRQDTPKELKDRRFTLRDTVAPLPGEGYQSQVVSPAPRDVIARSTWQTGCPLEATDLAYLRVNFFGFDNARHTGELLVNKFFAPKLVRVFGDLYRARFPIEQMQITTRKELDAAPTGDGNNTGAFTCRPAVGQKKFSMHAYGLAIDVNPFHNPYVSGDTVVPELASAYVDRSQRRPGMIHPGDAVVRAFDSIGWSWGGSWTKSKDYQHFSVNGQ